VLKRLTNNQKKALHAGAREAKILDGSAAGEARYRIALRSLGGCHSAADPGWTREGFCRVMAFFELQAGGRLRGNTEGYWAGESRKLDSGGEPATDRYAWRIEREARRLGWTAEDVDAFLASDHCTQGRFARVADAPSWALSKLLEAMKAMAARNAERGTRNNGLTAKKRDSRSRLSNQEEFTAETAENAEKNGSPF